MTLEQQLSPPLSARRSRRWREQMSTGMRKWMEKDCPETEYLSAQVLIDREELKQLRADLEKHKAERDALRAKIAEMERQEPVGEIQRANSTGNYINSVVWVPMAVGSKLYALPGAKGEEK